MYYKTPTLRFEEAGIRLVIWANHMLRTAIRAMQQTAARICADRSLLAVEEEIVTVKEVFRLQNAAELKSAEARYLPTKPAMSKAA